MKTVSYDPINQTLNFTGYEGVTNLRVNVLKEEIIPKTEILFSPEGDPITSNDMTETRTNTAGVYSLTLSEDGTGELSGVEIFGKIIVEELSNAN